MGLRLALVRLLCLTLMVSAVLWPLHGHAKVAESDASAPVGCCKSEPAPKPAGSNEDDGCCGSCTFGTCCLRMMVAERGTVALAAADAVEVPGVLASVVLTGLVQLEDIFHPPRA